MSQRSDDTGIQLSRQLNQIPGRDGGVPEGTRYSDSQIRRENGGVLAPSSTSVTPKSQNEGTINSDGTVGGTEGGDTGTSSVLTKARSFVFNNLLGWCFLLYGIIKIVIFILLVVGARDPTARVEIRRALPFLAPFMTSDLSMAGLFADVCLLIFGIFSLFHGARELTKGYDGVGDGFFGGMIKFLGSNSDWVEYNVTLYFITFILGSLLVIVYTIAIGLAVFDKDDKTNAFSDPVYRSEYAMYWLFGWSFISSGIYVYLSQVEKLAGVKPSLKPIGYGLLSFFIGFIIYSWFDYTFIETKAQKAQTLANLKYFIKTGEEGVNWTAQGTEWAINKGVDLAAAESAKLNPDGKTAAEINSEREKKDGAKK